MLSGLWQWITGHSAGGGVYEQAFVREVRISRRVPSDPKVVRFIFVCWLLIAVKHVLVIWLVLHYRMPFHQLIVNFPTWLIAAVATAAYYRRTQAE